MSVKQEVRRQLLNQRQAMTSAVWRQKSDAICEYLLKSSLLGTARTVFAYTSFRQEADVMPLIERLAGDEFVKNGDNGDRVFGFPRCEGKLLCWHQWQPGRSVFQSGAYGILEPSPTWPKVDTSQLTARDVILVPAVGCDRQGYRLGYGGGFYDRMLSEASWASIIKIGVTFDFSYVDSLPIDPWDQSLNGVCTESGLTLMV